MEAQKQPQPAQTVAPAPPTAPAPARSAITPDAVESALAILGEVAKHFAVPGDPVPADLAPQNAPLPQAAQAQPAPASGTLGEYADRLEAIGTTLMVSPTVQESRLKSSRLWTMIGTVATLVSQHPLGFELSPVTQVCIVGVAAIYIAARSIKGETTGG